MAKTGTPLTRRPAIAALVAIIAIQLWGVSHAADSGSKGSESDSDYWLRVMRTGRADGQRGTKPGLGDTPAAPAPATKPVGTEKRRRKSSRSPTSSGSGRRRSRVANKNFDREPSPAYTAQGSAEVPVEKPPGTAPEQVPTEAGAFYDALKQMLNKMGFNEGGAVPVGGESGGIAQFPYATSPYTVSSAQNYYYPVQQVRYGGEVPNLSWSNLASFFGGPSRNQDAEQEVTTKAVDSDASEGTGMEESGIMSAAEDMSPLPYKVGDKSLPMLWYRKVTPVKKTQSTYHYPTPTYPVQPVVQQAYHPVQPVVQQAYHVPVPVQPPVLPVYPSVQPAPCVGTHCKETQSVHNLVVVPVEKEPEPEVEIQSVPEPEPEPTPVVHVHVKPLPKVRTVGMALRRRREDLSLAFHHGSLAPSTAMWGILKSVANYKEVFPLSFYKELSDGTSIWITKVTSLCDGLQGGPDDAKRVGLFLALYYWRFLAKPEGDGGAKRVVLVIEFDVDLSPNCSSLYNAFLDGLLVNPREPALQAFLAAPTADELSDMVERCKGGDCDRVVKSPVSDIFIIPPPSGSVTLPIMSSPMMSNCNLWFSKDPSFDDMKRNLLNAIVGDTGSVEEAKAALPESYGGTNKMALADAPSEKKLLSLVYNLIGNRRLPDGAELSQSVAPADLQGSQYPGWEEWVKSGNAVTYPYPVMPAAGTFPVAGDRNVGSLQSGVGSGGSDPRGVAGNVFSADPRGA